MCTYICVFVCVYICTFDVWFDKPKASKVYHHIGISDDLLAGGLTPEKNYMVVGGGF